MWDGSSDQYIVDFESKYPIFSDIQTNDFAITSAITPAITSAITPARVHNFEDKYQTEQQGRPAYYKCRCNACSMSDLHPRARPPMRTHTIDQRDREREMMHETHVAMPEKQFEITPNINVIAMVLIFIVFIYICCFCVKTVSELVQQLKILNDRAI